MEYKRTNDAQIQASQAYRLSVILKEYIDTHRNNDNNNYDVTLSISILQTLLTNCIELFDRTASSSPSFLRKNIKSKNDYDLSLDSVIENTFNHRFNIITIESVLRHLRNALSHPTIIKTKAKFVTTGYTSIAGTDGKISYILFSDSRDIDDDGKPKDYWIENRASNEQNKKYSYFKEGVIIVEKNGKYTFEYEGNPYYRTFQIKLSPKQIVNLTYSLANFLSKPVEGIEHVKDTQLLIA